MVVLISDSGRRNVRYVTHTAVLQDKYQPHIHTVGLMLVHISDSVRRNVRDVTHLCYRISTRPIYTL